MRNNLFSGTISASLRNILTDALNGKFPIRVGSSSSRDSNLFGSGVSIFLGEDSNLSSSPKERNIVTLSPNASIIIKKKAFSSFKGDNDLQWLDRTENMLLRATKALFAYKVAQIRAYESLTKVEEFFADYAEINMSLLAELYHNAQFLSVDPDIDPDDGVFKQLLSAVSSSLEDAGYDDIKQDVLLMLERNVFASDVQFTTWIVDPNDTSNFGTGPGTGVIELGLFSSFQTSLNLNSEPSSASFSLDDPHRIMTMRESDIEIAIEEAVLGTIGLLSSLSDPAAPPIDTRSIVGAGMTALGLGGLDNSIDIDYIRDRLRIFYLGKPFINAGDGVHFFIRGNKTVEDFAKEEAIFDRDFLSVDETMLEAERILFTNKKIDFDTYKQLRQFSDNSFGMRHVFGGFVTDTSESWGGGAWTLKVNCVDNMGWLKWSRFMENPALQDPQGVLEDPLTPYEIKTDANGTILSAGGPQLLEENKQLIRSGLLFYDSGILNGQVATENNLLQGQYNKSGSLSGAKILQHPQGLVYRWKEGIITATAGVSVVDPFDENQVTQKLHNQTYGLNVAENVLNNLDIANILSILIVGQPYNVETFIDQAYQAHNITSQSGSLSNVDPLSAVLDVVRRQNNHFGDFRPYRMVTMSSETLLQTANTNILRNEQNENVKQLQDRRIQLDSLIRRLEGESNGFDGTGILISSLKAERQSIQDGIQTQINSLKNSGAVSSVDLATQNFNLFGRSKTLPLTGNFTADHQITRAMTLLGAQRKIEDVRLNRDKNLFIVSDQYDEQSDVRPFIFALRDSNYKIFKGNFVSIFEKCSGAAGIMNLEFFCNTQGHLEFRPPQWNKTPLTVLQRLFDINGSSNKKIVPEFLTEVFQTRSNSLRREIHSLNVRIVILSLLMNKYPDRELIPNFNSSVSNNLLPPGTGTGKKSLKFFGVDESKGTRQLRLKTGNLSVGLGDAIATGDQLLGDGLNLEAGVGREGDILNGDTETLLGNFDPIFQESIGLSNNVLTVASQPSSVIAIDLANASNLNALRESFVKLSGIDPASDLVTDNGRFVDSAFIFNNSFTGPDAELNNVAKASNYLKKLQETISNRDNLVTILLRNREKQNDLNEIEEILSGEFQAEREDVTGGIFADVTNVTNDALDVADRVSNTAGVINDIFAANNTVRTISDIFTGDSERGSLFDHLISDDTRNLLGPGSGKRHIIYDHDIISCSFVEQPPDFCRVDVVGDAPIISSSLSTSFEDRYFWAGATDFDLWRQYGYKAGGGNISLPFANDAETQSKPYAVFQLQLQRLKINQGSISIVGNEYYEPGDTVYIPGKELLYYVRSVSHSYAWGQDFSTTLSLEFGHPPGTYLPSPLDIIGQQFMKDPLSGSILTYRNAQGDDNYRALQPDSSIVFPNNKEVTEAEIPLLLDHKDNAVRFNNIMADLSSILIGNRIVLIRGFVKIKGGPEEQAVRERIAIIKSMLQNPVSLTQSDIRGSSAIDTPTFLLDNILDIGSSALGGLGSQTGTTKGSTPLILPNGLPVSPIPSDKIAEQIVFLDGTESVSEIQCLNPSLLQSQTLDGKKINIEDYQAVFPRGGPKQRSWLDIKARANNNPGVNDSASTFVSTAFNVSNVIEIGILDIERAMGKAIKKTEISL